MAIDHKDGILFGNSEPIANNTRIVRSKKKEDAINASDQISDGGTIVVVSYGTTSYVKVTDGAKTFSALKKLGEGEDAGSVAWGTITGTLTAQGDLNTALAGKASTASVTAKVSKAGDTMTSTLNVMDTVDQSKIIVGKYISGSHANAPVAFDKTAVYFHVGGIEYAANSYRLIGFGYRRNEDQSHAAAVIGYQETNTATDDAGRLLFATRPTPTDVAPTIRLTIEPNGEIQAKAGAKFVGDGSGLTALVVPAQTWASITGKPTTFAPIIGTTATTAAAGNHTQAFTTITGIATLAQLPALTIAKTTGLQTALDAKLTATQGAAVPDAVAAPTMEEYNGLLAVMRAAGLIAT